MDQLLQAHTPVRFSARNPRPGFRVLRSGHIYTLNLELDEESWLLLKTMPDSALLDVTMWWHDGDDEAPVKAERGNGKREKGEFGSFWQELFRHGFDCSLDLREALGIAEQEYRPNDVKEALYREFGVDSLAKISPTQLERWGAQNELHGLVVMIRTTQARLSEADDSV